MEGFLPYIYRGFFLRQAFLFHQSDKIRFIFHNATNLYL